MKNKAEFTVTLEKHQFAFLGEMARKYNVPDESKALRCLINFSIQQGAQQSEIFGEIRCLDCGT